MTDDTKALAVLIRDQPVLCDGQLPEWREQEDRIARAENALLRYYVQTWVVFSPRKHEPVLTVLAA